VIVLQSLGFIVLLVAAYLIGAIPFGLIVGKVFYGVDVRKKGSGNVGTTNVFRVLGKKAGIAVLVLDMLKGFIPAIIATWLFAPWPAIFIAAAPEVGHVYSIYLKGSGGKGVATGAGIVLALVPAIFLILVLVWIAVFLTTRYVSVASLTAAVLTPILTVLLSEPAPYKIAALLAMLLVIWAHRGNISRLRAGTENRVTLPFMHHDSASGHPLGR
jgi:glycerol-3-phosphate acyltransferase PlsY